MSNMSVRISPILIDRYAQALFDLALERKVLDTVFDDVMGLEIMGEVRKRLSTFFESPQFNDRDKARLIRDCFGGRVSDVLLQFMLLVLSKGRMMGLSQMLSSFVEKVSHHRGVWRAEIVTAVPLSEMQQSQLDKTMEGFMRGQMNIPAGDPLDLSIDFRVEPRMMGGVRFMCGNTLIDDTVRGKLDRMQAGLMSIISQ